MSISKNNSSYSVLSGLATLRDEVFICQFDPENKTYYKDTNEGKLILEES